MVGGEVFTGGPVTAGVTAEKAIEEPAALVAMTADRTAYPTSVLVSGCEALVAPEMLLHAIGVDVVQSCH
jgi:hypothetical protein